jgi:HAD superfamily hydrolase (TIGR01509 family)
VNAILDIDGTLVDTNYQHAIAWYRAFRDHGIVLPLWRIHRRIGMGGDQMIKSLTDQATEDELGDSIREAETRAYSALMTEVETMKSSRELIEQLKRRGHAVILASSAKPEEVEHYLDLLDARDLADDWTTAADVEETKPAPDLVHSALDRANGTPDDSVLIGDSPWDVEAARNAGVETLAVLTGGFSADELRDAGAKEVFESVAELCSRLDETVLS